jgi:hypothetical protein
MPLLGIGACVSRLFIRPIEHTSNCFEQVSVQFSSFHGFRQGIESYNQTKDPEHAPTLSLTQFYLSGAGAGVVTSIISGPVEHIRIRLQTRPPWSSENIQRTLGLHAKDHPSRRHLRYLQGTSSNSSARDSRLRCMARGI